MVVVLLAAVVGVVEMVIVMLGFEWKKWQRNTISSSSSIIIISSSCSCRCTCWRWLRCVLERVCDKDVFKLEMMVMKNHVTYKRDCSPWQPRNFWDWKQASWHGGRNKIYVLLSKQIWYKAGIAEIWHSPKVYSSIWSVCSHAKASSDFPSGYSCIIRQSQFLIFGSKSKSVSIILEYQK